MTVPIPRSQTVLSKHRHPKAFFPHSKSAAYEELNQCSAGELDSVKIRCSKCLQGRLTKRNKGHYYITNFSTPLLKKIKYERLDAQI